MVEPGLSGRGNILQTVRYRNAYTPYLQGKHLICINTVYNVLNVLVQTTLKN